MPVPSRVYDHPDQLGDALAALIVERIAARGPDRPFLLGCPGGRSLRSTYRALGRRVAASGLDLHSLVIVMMDEYVELTSDGRPMPVEPSRSYSCRRFGTEEILGRLNTALPAARAVPAENLWLPDPADPDNYERRLDGVAGIDLFLLASGAGDGHVAFNPPGADKDSRTRVVRLPESTRRDNLATFPEFGGELSAVPAHGVTVGVATIRDRSAEAIMVLHGTDKRLAAHRLTQAAGYRPDWPATVISECRAPQIFLDRAAAGAVLASTPVP